jgi:phosphate-selective porin O/P
MPPGATALPVEVHGFVSQGFIKSAHNDYLAKSKRGSFEFAEVGINFTSELTRDLRAGVQLFARDLGSLGNYAPKLDWYYLDYQFFEQLGIRVGRTKVPFGLYNEVNDIDVARVPILLPASLYPADHRDYLLAQIGAELYGTLRLGAAGALEYRAYGGTFQEPPPGASAPGVSISNVAPRYLFGGRAMWATPLDGLQAGASAQVLRLDSDIALSPALLGVFQPLDLVPADLTSAPTPTEFRVTRWVASIEYSAHDLLLSAEYSRFTGEFESRIPVLLPPHIVNERYYVMASYRVNSWFTPGVYYSAYYPNMDDKSDREDYQHDLAATVRYDLLANWILKLEGHFMHGTAALSEDNSLNDGVEPEDLAPTWGVFLIKTTAYF